MDSTSVLVRAGLKIAKIQEAAKYEGSLMDFAEYVWPVVEPAIPFIRGWAIEAIAEHLEAVTYGQIKRLLMNVPPGFTKSLMTDVFWPAWEWGPRNMPWLRYICASYSSHLTERDNMRCRNIVISDRYRKMWGHRFGISNEQFTKIKFANDHTGWKLATSVGGIGVGERGDRFICFPYEEVVHTADGLLPIGWIVERRMPIKVLSFDTVTGYSQYLEVSGWHKNPGQSLLKVGLSDGNFIRCTANHQFLVGGRWIAARELVPGLILTIGGQPKPLCKRPPRSPAPNGLNRGCADVVDSSELAGGIRSICGYASGLVGCELASLVSATKRAVLFCIRNIFGASSIFQIYRSVVQRIAIFMAGVVSFGARPQECSCDNEMYVKMHSFAVSSKIQTSIIGTFISSYPDRLRQDSCGLGDKPVAIPNRPSFAHDAPKSRGHVVWESRDVPPDLSVLSVVDDGHVNDTYCLTVCPTHTFCVGSGLPVVVANCDDPNNTMEMESEITRDTTNMWFTEVVPDRLNNPQESAIIVIQQRLHEDDVSGIAISRNMGFTHLMIPMEHDVSRHCKTFLGWRPDGTEKIWDDPRKLDDELAWPDRFTRQICEDLERDKGPYAWAGQYQQSPEPRGGSIIKRDFWQLWEQKHYPPFEFILASLDTAFTAKEENDASALTVWGVFRDDVVRDVETAALWTPRDGSQVTRQPEGNPRIMLIYAWQERLEFHDLIQAVIDTCTISRMPKKYPQFPVDRLLVEAKANGMSVGHELMRMFSGTGKLGIELINPALYGDKVARVQSIQHIFSDKMIYAPDKDFADMVINQCAVFPKGSRDDLVDSTSMAIRWLRDMGFAPRREEYAVETEESMLYKSPRSLGPLYPA